jgi:hypothetical protein
MDVNISDISDIIAKRLNIPKKVIEEINRSQWNLLKDEMQCWDYNTVKIFYIGKFTKKKKKTEKQLYYSLLGKQKNELNKSESGDI